jgi:uncharacterized membrane protein YdjX (TVP38/TMEM64 family)
MVELLINYFEQIGYWAIVISVLVNIIIAILGLVPSVFLTVANILFFGFWQGTLISFFGEAIGAWIAFYLYRKGFKKLTNDREVKHKLLNQLTNAKGLQAFTIIFSLRLLPFVPSGIVTFIAALGKVSTILFVIASSVGKIPSLLIEAYSAYQLIEFSWQGKLILVGIAFILLVMSLNRRKTKSKQTAE